MSKDNTTTMPAKEKTLADNNAEDNFLADSNEAGKKKTIITNGHSEKKADDLALQTQQGNGLPLTPIDLNTADIPDLDDADVVPLDLSSNYWSPTGAGEQKRVYFDSIKTVQYSDPKEEDVIIDLQTAFFFEKTNGQIKSFSNASKRLIAVFERNHIERGTPVLITYMGKKKNSTNPYMSDDWSVKPLMIKIK